MSNIQAEQSVLGAIMLDNTIFDKIKTILEPIDFYNVHHQTIYKAMIKLETGIDVITLNNHLKKSGKLETCGNTAYIAFLSSSVPTSANALYYAKIVKDLSVKRKLKETLNNASTNVDAEEVDTSITKALEKLSALRMDTSDVSAHHVNTMAGNVAVAMMQPGEDVRGVKTHIEAIDKSLGGLRNSDLIIIAARPSMGKTAFALSMALNMATNGDPVLIVSLEMAKEQLVERFLCQIAGVSMQEIILRENLKENAIPISQAAQKLHDSPIHIADNIYKYSKIEDVIRLSHADHSIKAVFIDYLQLIALTKNMGDNRNQQLGYVTRSLKKLAKDLSIPVVLLSQLNRNLEQRPDKRPKLSDLRDSGEIEQDIDIAMLLYRDEVYDKESKDAGTVEVDVPKARNLSPAWMRLAFLKESMRFANLAHWTECDED